MDNLKFVRPQKLAQNIIFVDGLSASEKTLIAPLLSTIEHGGVWIVKNLIEYLCSMNTLTDMGGDSAKTLIQMLTDLDLYNLMISRNVNFRPDDASGTDINLLTKSYQKRLKLKDGDQVMKQIATQNPFLIIMLHFQFIQSQLLFETLKDRLSLYAISVRHPLWLIESWHQGAWHRGLERQYGGGWGKRFGTDPREFTLCCNINGNIVPWFAADWHEEYVRLKPLDQAIQTVYYLCEKIENRYAKMSAEDQQKVLFIPFERFVVEPEMFIRQMVQSLKTEKTPLTSKMMKKIQVPRKPVSTDEIRIQREKIGKWMDEEKALPETQDMVNRMCSAYEQKYLESELFAQRVSS